MNEHDIGIRGGQGRTSREVCDTARMTLVLLRWMVATLLLSLFVGCL